jgi:hypothetical protein
MIAPFFALIAVIVILITYFIMNAKKKDQGNTPGK